MPAMPSRQELGQFPPIEGAGLFPPKGQPLEERFRLIGERQVERMLAKEKWKIILLISPEHFELLQGSKPLFSGPGRRSDVKVRPDGQLLYTTWRDREIEMVDSEPRLKKPKRGELPDFVVLWPKRPRLNYQERLSKGTEKVAQLLVHDPANIEEAIREVSGILEVDVAGEAREIIGFVQFLSQQFLFGEITDKRLEELAEKTADFLTDKGLGKPSSAERKKMVTRLKKACARDSKGRINQLISRIRLGSAHLYWTRRMVEVYLIRKKHGSNLEDLTYEREITRWSLSTAAEQLENFAGHVAFKNPKAKISDFQIRIMSNVLDLIVRQTLAKPRVKDYLLPARAAAINLVGCEEDKREANRQIFGDELADKLFSKTPVPELLKEQQFKEARGRIKESVRWLRATLTKHTSIETTEAA